MRLIDTHAHLDEMPDPEGVLTRARDAGVKAVIAVGTDRPSNEKVLELAARFPAFVLPSLGIHPWRLEGMDLETNLRFIQKEIRGCLALGEVGLDFAIGTSREKQEEAFSRILAIASRESKPVLLHARRAWGEAFRMLDSRNIEKAVFHWYSGPLEVLKEIIARGYFISATPAAGYSRRHRESILAAPLDQLLLETDCPEVYRGQASEPKDLCLTLGAVSEIKGLPREEIAAQTFLNAVKLFQLPSF